MTRKGIILAGCCEQAAHAAVRQAHGLLPNEHVDAERHSRCAAYQHPARYAPFCRAAGRRCPLGHEHSVRGAAQPGLNRPEFCR